MCNSTKNSVKNILVRSFYKELINIYISRQVIIDKLIKRFTKRKISLNSRANNVISRNKHYKVLIFTVKQEEYFKNGRAHFSYIKERNRVRERI